MKQSEKSPEQVVREADMVLARVGLTPEAVRRLAGTPEASPAVKKPRIPLSERVRAVIRAQTPETVLTKWYIYNCAKVRNPKQHGEANQVIAQLISEGAVSILDRKLIYVAKPERA